MTSEGTQDFITICFMFGCILSFYFVFFKKIWLAWILGTFLTPFLGIAFLAIIYDPLALYYLYALPFIVIATGLISTIIAVLKYYISKKRSGFSP